MLEEFFIDFLGLQLFNPEDTIKFVIRFLFNFVVVFSISRYIYYPTSRKKDFLFTFSLISSVIFLICFLLDNVKLQMGLALGLFAIFGIIRYRTDAIPIKEMTYIFIVIGLSVVNSLANKKISFIEVIIANSLIVFITILLEKMWFIKHEVKRLIRYEIIENIKLENYNKLLEDIKNRLGIIAHRVEVGKIDLLNDTALLTVYYYEEDQKELIQND
jgi:hypothetical protein